MERKKIVSGYIIDVSDLKPGDIIVSTTKKPLSILIRTFTFSQYSHVMLYVNRSSIIHSDGNCIHSYNTQRIVFKKRTHCAVYRPKKQLKNDQIDKLISYVSSKVGTRYGTIEATVSPIFNKNIKTKKYFCSRLIAEAYASIGIYIVRNPYYCTPKDIYKSPLLRMVTNPLKLMSEKDKYIFNETSNLPLEQSNATNYILKESRLLFNTDTIETLSDVDMFLIQNQNFDKKVSLIFINSGYLMLWQKEMEKNYVLYDYNLFSQVSKNERNEFLKYKDTLIKKSENFYKQKMYYFELYNNTKLSTFKMLFMLYQTLVNNFSEMLNVIELEEKNIMLSKIEKNIVEKNGNIYELDSFNKVFGIKLNSFNELFVLFQETKVLFINRNWTEINYNYKDKINELIKEIKTNSIYESNEFGKYYNEINSTLNIIEEHISNIDYIELRMKRDPSSLYEDIVNRIDNYLNWFTKIKNIKKDGFKNE